MISIALCGVAFLACVYFGRRSLVAGLCALTTVGYCYGITRANLPDGFSHLIFDAGVIGLFAAQLTLRQPVWQHNRSHEVRNWLMSETGAGGAFVDPRDCRCAKLGSACDPAPFCP